MVTSIKISKGAVINIGDYSGVKVDVEITADVRGGDVTTAVEEAIAELSAALSAQVEPVLAELPEFRANHWRERLGIEKYPEAVDDNTADEEGSKPEA